MKAFDDDGTPMEPCNSCGYFGDFVGRLMSECCNGSSGCDCKGQAVDCGPCQVCSGTGWRRKDADTQANLRAIRSMADAGRGYLGSGPRGSY